MQFRGAVHDSKLNSFFQKVENIQNVQRDVKNSELGFTKQRTYRLLRL